MDRFNSPKAQAVGNLNLHKYPDLFEVELKIVVDDWAVLL